MLWFTKLLRPLVQHLREKLGYRVLPYIEDFLAAPCPYGQPSTARDCSRAGMRSSGLFRRLGIVHHPGMGFWEGTRQLDHLGMHLDTDAMKEYMSDAKVRKVRGLAKRILLLAQRNRRLVSLELLRNFCGVFISLSLAVPLARFHTRSVYLLR